MLVSQAPIDLLTTHVGKPIDLLTTHVGKPIVLLTTHVGKPRKYKAKFDNLLLAKNLIQNKYETQP